MGPPSPLSRPEPGPSSSLLLEPLTAAIGAEIVGVDLAQPLDPTVRAAVWQALGLHHVLVFRGQELTDHQQVVLAGQFGTVTPSSPIRPSIPGHPEITELDTGAGYGREGEDWHCDMTYVATPPVATVVRPVALPPVGGDTIFVSTEAAYRRLSPTLQAFATAQTAVHDGTRLTGDSETPPTVHWDGETWQGLDPVEHPAVTADPIGGQPGLFVNPLFTTGLVGLPEHLSQGLLDLLYEHVARPEHALRLRWELDMVVLRKNRTIWHRLVADDPGHRWAVHRVSIGGRRPSAAGRLAAVETQVSERGASA